MQFNLKKLFSLFFVIAFSLFIVGCNKIKTGPAEVGDRVFVQYTATFDKYPNIIYDTTNKEITKKVKKTHNSIGYETFVLGKDDSINKYLQDAIVGMKTGEIKKVTLKPVQLTKSGYNNKNILSEPGFIYQKANINIKKGGIKVKNNQYVRVKAILGKGKTQKILFDMNPLDTYNDVTYTIKLLQVGGSKLK